MSSPSRPSVPTLVISPSASSSTSAAASRASTGAGKRARSSSLVSLQQVPEDPQQVLDRGAHNNHNADWVNFKGAWVIHVVLITLGKILVDVVPGMSQEISWSIVTCGYMAVTFLMFHHRTGVPFESNSSGAWDELTMWEQIDGGAQYTPARKWLTCVPIGLFLISTHYTKYKSWLFAINFTALLIALAPKLPLLHRQRVRFLEPVESTTTTPVSSRPRTPIHGLAPPSSS